VQQPPAGDVAKLTQPVNRLVLSPLTFSSSNARGLMASQSSTAQAYRSRSSVAPSCRPATVNGGQGTPPASSATPA
jgi:hypothetical protein